MFSDCFGKKSHGVSTSDKITEVASTSKVGGKCLIEPLEEDLLRGGKSKSIRMLERAILAARKSGLLSESVVYAEEQRRLLQWKIVTSRLSKSTASINEDRIRSGIVEFKKFNLQDEDGVLGRAEKILEFIQVRKMLKVAIVRQNIEDLHLALHHCEDWINKDEDVGDEVRSTLLDAREEARSVIRMLEEEQMMIKRNPNFPKEELVAAIDARNIRMLETSIRRWERLQLDPDASDYRCGLRVLGQLIELQRLVAVQGLEEGLKERDGGKVKENIQLGKEAGLPSKVLDFYADKVLPVMSSLRPAMRDLVLLIQQKNFKDLVEKVAVYAKLESSLNDDVIVNDVIKCDVIRNPSLDYEYDDVIENAKAGMTSFNKEVRDVMTSSKQIAQAYSLKHEAQEAMRNQLIKFNEELLKIAEEYSSNLPDPLGNRASPREDLIRDLNPFLQEHEGSLGRMIDAVRSSQRSFDVCRKQNEGRISGRGASCTGALDLGDLNILNEGEAILGVIRRCVDVSSAEKSLSLFHDAPSSPRDISEVGNALGHIERSLEILTTSELYKSSDDLFIDLCYNRPPEADMLRINREENDLLNQILASLEVIFPIKVILKMKKSAELRLAELRLHFADLEAESNSVRYELGVAINSGSESDIMRALKSSAGRLHPHDVTVREAEEKLAHIRSEKQKCRETLLRATLEKSKDGLEAALLRADEIYVAPCEVVVVNAQRELMKIKFDLKRKKEALGRLTDAVESKDADTVRSALSHANVCQVFLNDPVMVAARRILDGVEVKKKKKAKEVGDEMKRIEKEVSRNLENSKFLLKKCKFPQSKLFLSKFLLKNGAGSDFSQILIEGMSKYLEDVARDVEEGRITKRVYEDLRGALEDVGKIGVPPDVVRRAEVALMKINEKRAKMVSLRSKLEVAVASDSLEDLASIIVSAEASGVLDFDVDDKVDEGYELLARAREKFAFLKAERRWEGEEKMKRRVSSARKSLKRAMMNEKEPGSLREAVEVFRMVCQPLEGGKEGEVERVDVVNEIKDKNDQNKPRNGLIHRAKTPSLRLKQIESNVRYFPQISEKEPKKRMKRPATAISRIKTPSPPLPRIVWGGERNLQLLRKAEKNLRRLEEEEQERMVEEESKVMWRKMKINLEENLRVSMKFGDRADMWRAVHEFTRYIGEESLNQNELKLLNEARTNLKLVTIQQYKENLTNAIKQRNIEILENILYQIENESEEFLPNQNLDNKFYADVTKGHQVLSHLCQLKKFRTAVMCMTRSLVSEITSYPSPPGAVRAVMAATYLLLGEDEKTIKSWSSLHSLMGKLGRESLTRRVAHCDSTNISLQVAQKSWALVSDLNFDKVKATNPGASTFYAWVTCMVNEIYGRNGIEIPTNEKKTLPRRFPSRKMTKKLNTEFWQRIARPHKPLENRNNINRKSKRVLKRPRTACI